jgi:hypothetical protein
VLRALLIAALLCFSFELSGLAALCGDPGCTEDCPTESSGGQCPPNCRTCGCCSLPKTEPVLVSTDVVGPPTGALAWLATFDGPRTPEPVDIFHIPKFLVA